MITAGGGLYERVIWLRDSRHAHLPSVSSHVRSHVFHTVALGARPSTSSAAVAEPGVASQRLKLTYQELTAGVSVMYGSSLRMRRDREALVPEGVRLRRLRHCAWC